MKYRSQIVLEKISIIENRIEQLKFELEELEKNRVSVRAVSFDKVPGGSSCRGEAAFEKTGDKIADLEREIRREIESLSMARHDAISLIQRLENTSQMNVLFMRYVKMASFDEIASELGYSATSVFRAHRTGLAALDKLLSAQGAA